MLLFIGGCKSCKTYFKRISKHLMLLFIFKTVAGLIGQKHFKTSHVIVYLHGLYCGYTAGLFQNISCYCLSEFKTYETEPVNIFQNISCYCLSFLSIGDKLSARLFQNISCYCLSQSFSFCSSPVSVFQNISCYCLSVCTFFSHAHAKSFQNISCYCLSPTIPA